LEAAETAVWREYYKVFTPPSDDASEPASDLFYPIVDNIDRIYVTGAGDYEPANHSVVGLLYTGEPYLGKTLGAWQRLGIPRCCLPTLDLCFLTTSDVLPKDSHGVHVVIENECTRSFTYQINGPVVQFLGTGDRHDRGYDVHVVRRRLDDLGEFATHDSVYSGAPLHREYCPFTFNVYPSNEMKEAFTTNNPIIFASIAVVIFLFTSLVFFLYDRKVERCQETVLSSAKRSTKIVSSLFPSTVRDKLYPLPERPVRRNSLDAFMPGKLQSQKDNTSSTDCSTSSIACSPIADLYPDTTVLFADIAGFTAWSSARPPTQVFHLLETVYSAFDSIARQRGVFKVETIGDSYVAVVGLPTPRKHHAVVMAMFANDCRAKFREVTMELEKTLGPVRVAQCRSVVVASYFI
jgi:Adenylate and Guanylate cyclase catalytic domain